MSTRTCLSNTLSAVLSFFLLLFVGCGSSNPTGSIQITASSSTLAVGTTMQLHATDTNFLHMVSDATATATWSSSNPAIVSVNSSGLATGLGAGSATIKAVLTKDAGTIALTVPVVPSLALSPANASVVVGGTQQYSATATSSSSTPTNVTASTTWSVLPNSVASMNSGGLLTAVAPGTFTVTGVNGSQTGTITGTVAPVSLQSIAVTPATSTLSAGGTQQFTAVGTYNDGTSHDVTSTVSWSTSNAALLSVTASGLATPASVSATTAVTVTATLGSIAGTASVQITPSATVTKLIVEPTSSSIAAGSAEQHTAIAWYSDGTQKDVTKSVLWSSIDASTSSVDATGVNTAITPGKTTLQASLTQPSAHLKAHSVADAVGPHASTASVTASSVVIVTPATITALSIRASRDFFPVGSTQPIQLTGTFSDGSSQDLSLTANWQSSDPTVATINQTGLATGVHPGKVVFSASFGGLTTSTIGFQVLPSNLISTTIAVDFPAALTGVAQNVRVIGTYSDGTTHDVTALATFVSSDPSVYEVNSAGLAYGVSSGGAQITATVGGFSAITTVFSQSDPVTSMDVFPATPKIAAGTHYQFAAALHGMDPELGAFVLDVTQPAIWYSSDPSILTIDGNGLAKTGKAGTTTVYATMLGVTKYSDPITVTNATLQKLVLSQEPSAVAINTGFRYAVTGFFSDGSVQDVSDDVTWDTSDNTTASIDSSGLCLGMKPGQVQVTATLMGQTVSTPLTVTNATLVSTALTPGNGELPLGNYGQYKLIGTFTDGTTQDLTYGALFASPTPSIVSFLGSQGLAAALSPGVGQLSGQYGYFTASTPVTVTKVATTGLMMTPATATIRQGSAQQFVITGTYSDGYSQVLNEQVFLSSSSPQVAPAVRSGLIYGTAIGTSTLTAAINGLTTTAKITVLSNVLSSITLAPANPVVTAGTPQQLTATGTYADGSTGDVTSTVTWTSSNPALVTVSSTGVATALGNSGSAVVTASSGTNTTSFTVSVQPANPGGGTNATPTSILVSPTSTRLAAGTTRQLTALATYANGSTADISSSVTWASSSAATATISPTGLLTAVQAGTAGIQASLGTLQSSSTVVVSSATLQSLAISPSGANFGAGSAQQFTLIGTFSDGTTQNLTSSATWGTSNAALASISALGLATGIAPGSVQFTASYGGQTTTSTTSTVTSATLLSVTLSPSTPSFAKGTTQQFTVTGTYSDGSTRDLTSSASFASSDPTVLGLSSPGLATGAGVGSAQVTVSAGGQSASTQSVTVTSAILSTLSITPKDLSFANGTTEHFTATGTFSDGTTQDLTTLVVWSSSNPQVLTIDQSGIATGGSLGAAQITAAFHGSSASTDPIRVTSATLTHLVVTPNTARIAKGTKQQFTATGTFSDGTTQNLSSTVTWKSVNGQIASIDVNGLATGNGVGSDTVTTEYIMGQTASTGSFTVSAATLVSLSFNPANPTVAAGTSTQVTVRGVYSDGTTQDLTSTALFSSSNNAVASVGNGGAILGGTPGTATITVSAGGETSAFPVTVSPATLASIVITPAHPSAFAKGTTQQFTAMGTFSDGTTQNLSSSAAWVSVNPGVFTIDNNGLATGTGIGSASLSASYQGQTTTTPAVQVTAAVLATIAVTPQNLSLAAGASQQFTANATYTDSTTQDLTSTVTWSSANTSALTINASALARAGAVFASTNVVLTAAYGSAGGSSNVTVTPAASSPSPASPLSLTVTPTSAHLAAGTATQLTATGTYPDGSTHDLSSSVTWTSASTATATVSATGLVSAVAPGTVAVQAEIQGQSGVLTSNSTVVVSAATLESVAISPSGASFAAGSSQQFTLTGTYSDGTTQNLTSSAIWGTSNAGVATLSSAGLAAGVGVGSVQFTATYDGQTITSTVDNVTAATLVSISVTPTRPSFAQGTTQQFTVTGTYSDGSTRDLTSSATFASSDSTVVSVSSSGLATGVGSGGAQITVSAGGQTASTQSVTVTPATLLSITLTPQNTSFADGSTQQFTARGTFSDGTTQDLTQQAVWRSSNPQAITIDQNGLATGGSAGSAQITVALNGVTASTSSVQVTPATLVSVTLSPTSAQIANGTTQQFTARGTYTDGSTQDLTSTVTWTSSNGQVVSINDSGLAVGDGVGSAQLTARYLSQTASTSSFAVTPATLVSLSFNPANPTVAAGTSTQIAVIGTYSDGTTQDLTSSATLTSSNPQVASLETTDVINGVSPGTSTITVAAGGQTSSFAVTVSSATLTSITITPTNPPSFAKGTTQQFTAIGTYSDGTTQNLSSTTSWLSSNTSVFTIDTHGLATGVGVGSATLTANSGSQSVTTPAVQVTPATVASLAVTPQNISLSSGSTQQYTATATYTDSTTADVTSSVTWASASTSVATISGSGLAAAAAAGTTAITAQLGSTSGSTTLTVETATPPLTPTLQQIVVAPASSTSTPGAIRHLTADSTALAGATQQFTATGVYSDQSTANLTSVVTWSSSLPSVATINASGLASALAAGSTSIQAQLGTVSGSLTFTVTAPAVTLQSINVSPGASSAAKGNTQQFTATAFYSDGSTLPLTTQVTWQSSAPSVATINGTGLATSLAGGNTQIWASFSGQSAVATLTVSPATLASLAVTQQSSSIASGTTQQYRATGTLSDGSTQDLTSSVAWSSSNSSLATINSTGLASASGTGIVTITATAMGNTVTNSAALTITSAVAMNLQVTPSQLSLSAGETQQLLITSNFSDGSAQNVTSAATYSTTNPSVVSVDSNGNLHAVGPGTATVTITLDGVTSTLTVTIGNAVVSTIAITPRNLTLAVGQSQQLTATATYTDGNTQDLTNSVTWASSAPAVATVSTTGNVIVAQASTATISATYNSISATDTITGTAAAITAIAVSPSSSTLAAGQTRQFAATASMSDGTQQTITASAHWSVSDPTKATVSNNTGYNGLLTSTAAGVLNVEASLDGTSGSAAVTVTTATLSSLTINPTSLSLPAGTAQQLSVTGAYSDGSSADVTASVTWSSSQTSIASVDQTALLHAVSAGTAILTATLQGVTGTAVATVANATLSSITLSPSNPALALGQTMTLTATGHYTDQSTANLTDQVQWSSSNGTVATISATGVVTTLTTGSSTLTATLNGHTQSTTLTVSAAVLQSISVQASASSFALGQSLQVKAMGVYTDGSTQDLTHSVTWSSSTASVAVVSSTGLATGVTTGAFSARATFNGITGTLPLTVTNAVLVSMAVTPANKIVVNLSTNKVQYHATGTFSDGTTLDITHSVHWAATSGVIVGEISSTGVFTPLGLGVGTVMATSGAISGNTTFTVIAAPI